MKNLFGVLAFLILLTSCDQNGRTIIVNTPDAEGFTTASKLAINGFEIGQVTQLDLAENGTVNLICKIDNNEVEIPVNSKFYIKNSNLLGNTGIGIELGTEKELLEPGAIIKMTINDVKDISDSFTDIINEMIEKLANTEQKDSLLYELRRLNKNIEGLIRVQKNY
ncbi:MlaD family protein [Spongiimicrobium salis]|uniref:MlaD family protein n=1 Tax=Spongiimicrobium salis TaxID=1667022 RepID=UPI00374DF8B5